MFGSRSSKVSKPISYPDELRLRTSGPDKTCTYRLSGVLVHQGRSGRDELAWRCASC